MKRMIKIAQQVEVRGRAGALDRIEVPPERAGSIQGRWWLLFSAWWILQILVVANARYLGMRLWGDEVSWVDALKASTLNYGTWALITVAAFFLAQRFPLSGKQRGRDLMVHLGAAITFVFIKVSSAALVAPHVSWLTEISLRDRLIFEAPNHALFYLLYLGAALAVVYYRRARDGEVLASRLEAQLARAELLLFRAQLNPHFLFNTLHAIAELMHRDLDAADRMVARLGELLREALRTEQAQMVRLDEELNFLRAYVDLEKLRYGDRLTVAWNIDPEVRDALVPSFVLQPLVENAIRHGLAPRRGPGLLEITATATGDDLYLRVCDNGAGFRLGAATRGTGVGLANTQARLERLYGAAHRLEVDSPDGGGTSVMVVLPLAFTAAESEVEALTGLRPDPAIQCV